MDRIQALNELKVRLSDKSLIKHSLAVEAVMRELAAVFKGDIEKWGLVGLLHDIDHDLIDGDPLKRGIVGAEILENLGVDEAVIYSIKANNDYNGILRKRKMDKSLHAADPLSRLIAASALMLPSKKFEDVTVKFILDKFNERDFEKDADRDQINSCVEIGMSLEQFIEIVLSAMKKIAGDLEL